MLRAHGLVHWRNRAAFRLERALVAVEFASAVADQAVGISIGIGIGARGREVAVLGLEHFAIRARVAIRLLVEREVVTLERAVAGR